MGTLCRMTHTNGLLNFTSLPRTRTGLPPHITGKRITAQDTNFPNRHWDTPTKLRNGRRKRTGSP